MSYRYRNSDGSYISKLYRTEVSSNSDKVKLTIIDNGRVESKWFISRQEYNKLKDEGVDPFTYRPERKIVPKKRIPKDKFGNVYKNFHNRLISENEKALAEQISEKERNEIFRSKLRNLFRKNWF